MDENNPNNIGVGAGFKPAPTIQNSAPIQENDHE